MSNTYTGDSDLLRSMARHLPAMQVIAQEIVREPLRLRITCRVVPSAHTESLPGVYPPSHITIQYGRMNPEPDWLRGFLEREYAAGSARPIGTLYAAAALTLRLLHPMRAEESRGVVVLDGEWELSPLESEADEPLDMTVVVDKQ